MRNPGQPSLLVFGINYEPEPTGIALSTTWLTESLTKRGWDVTVVTGMPHYPSWRRQSAPRRSYNGEVLVLRHVHYVPGRQSALRRAAYELSWTVTAAQSLVARRRPDLVLGIVPSLGGGVLARLASIRYHVPYALLFQDLLGRAAEQSGVPGAGRVAGVVKRIETSIGGRAERVGVVAEAFRDYFLEAGVPRWRIHRVRNPVRLGAPTEPREAVRARLGWTDEEFIVMHTGSMGYKQGLETVIEAADLARDDEQLRFVFQGDGNQKDALQNMTRKRRLVNVSFLPLAPQDDFPNILRAADASLLNQRGTVRNMSLPSKLGAYFAAGLPVVAAVAADDEVATEIASAGAGVVVEPDSPEALLNVIRSLRRDREEVRRLGAASVAYAERSFGLNSVLDSVEALLKSSLDSRSQEFGGPIGRAGVAVLNAAPSWLTRRFSANSAIARIVRPVVNRLVPNVPTPVAIRSGPAQGLTILINPRTEKYYWTGCHESDVQKAILDALEPGMTFWDIGAHIGFFTLLAARLVGRDGVVHAFEPNPEARNRLRRNLVLNGYQHVILHSEAVAARGGRASFYPHDESPMWSLHPIETSDDSYVDVATTTIDLLVRSLDSAPDVIKIDVERAELDVLRGGIELLRATSPVLLVEVSSQATLEEAKALLPQYSARHLSDRHVLFTVHNTSAGLVGSL
jgi:colanic acid biosynthesis glycosyl transferase WcaI